LIVAIDSLPLSGRYAKTGTYVYATNLLKGCLEIGESAIPGIEFHAFATAGDNWATNGFASRSLRLHESRILAQKRLWCWGGMAFSTSLLNPDLVFLPSGHGSIPRPFGPAVITLLDAMPFRLPSGSVVKPLRLRFLSWISARLARRIITISDCSKQDLVEIYGLDPANIDVTYLGYDKQIYNEIPADPAASAALLARFGIRRPFILHHGMVQLRKNVHRLIQAWDRMQGLCKEFDAQLVLAGPLGHGHEEILRIRRASANYEQIVLTGPLPDAELATLIKNASLCVIPSLYEGFCLPMVEAMACGAPTVASSNSCIPEISGGVLEYFDPYSVEEMAWVIRKGLEDSEMRGRLKRDGLSRAAEFSWERCARETLNVFVRTLAHD
jgi:glycosyltransferase involved in cell wall biosynthesis